MWHIHEVTQFADTLESAQPKAISVAGDESAWRGAKSTGDVQSMGEKLREESGCCLLLPERGL